MVLRPDSLSRDYLLAILNSYLDRSDALPSDVGGIDVGRDASYLILPVELHGPLREARNVLQNLEFIAPLGIRAKEHDPNRQLLIDVMLLQNWLNGVPGLSPDIGSLLSEDVKMQILCNRIGYTEAELIVIYKDMVCEVCSENVAVGGIGWVSCCPGRHFCHEHCARPWMEGPVGSDKVCPVCKIYIGRVA